MGKKKRPFYRIVAMNLTAPQGGHALAQVGIYDPINSKVDIDEDKAVLWLNRGAVMSDTVKALFDSQGVLARWKGLEPRIREDALTQDKPKRRRKLAAAEQAESAVSDADADVSEATPVAPAEEVAASEPSEATPESAPEETAVPSADAPEAPAAEESEGH
jgi:small subunit ribosomal protein S16